MITVFLLLRALSIYIDWCPLGRCLTIIGSDFRDLLKFEWVEKYQTLLGGLAALGAGAFVLLAARHATNDARATASAIKRQNSVTAGTLVGAKFIDTAVAISSTPYKGRTQDFSDIRAQAAQLSQIDPMLASVVLAAVREASSFDFGNLQDSQVTLRHGAAGQCYAMARILHHIVENLKIDGTYDFRNEVSIPPAELVSNLGHLAIEKEQIRPLDVFFDWNKAG
ncbi:hypothetical protein [Phyllobacterium meliloti]|uniref:hypothetical protein n=1 Tax=Phyllobacterium meliloti TaxID=555317 RepID=UPI001D136253|nr:hypothetical protein [Phyllobacterium sp. T1293]UGX87107.1 hypothetical protein LLE53_004470 [Phyllobacterium sp. T1293]